MKIKYKGKVFVEAANNDKRYIVEVLFDDHTSYYAITGKQVLDVLEAKGNDKRHEIVVDYGEETQIGTDAEIDLVLDSTGNSSWKELKTLWQEVATEIKQG